MLFMRNLVLLLLFIKPVFAFDPSTIWMIIQAVDTVYDVVENVNTETKYLDAYQKQEIEQVNTQVISVITTFKEAEYFETKVQQQIYANNVQILNKVLLDIEKLVLSFSQQNYNKNFTQVKAFENKKQAAAMTLLKLVIAYQKLYQLKYHILIALEQKTYAQQIALEYKEKSTIIQNNLVNVIDYLLWLDPSNIYNICSEGALHSILSQQLQKKSNNYIKLNYPIQKTYTNLYCAHLFQPDPTFEALLYFYTNQDLTNIVLETEYFQAYLSASIQRFNQEKVNLLEIVKNQDNALVLEQHCQVDFVKNGSYKGFCKYGKAEYLGSWLSNAFLYKGFFKQGKFNGLGILYKLTSDEYYIGDFKNNVFEGFGFYHFADGSLYYGHWQQGRPDGKGLWLEKPFLIIDDYKKKIDVKAYFGHWKQGIKQGKGLAMALSGKNPFVLFSEKEKWKNDVRLDFAYIDNKQFSVNNFLEVFMLSKRYQDVQAFLNENLGFASPSGQIIKTYENMEETWKTIQALEAFFVSVEYILETPLNAQPILTKTLVFKQGNSVYPGKTMQHSITQCSYTKKIKEFLNFYKFLAQDIETVTLKGQHSFAKHCSGLLYQKDFIVYPSVMIK